MTRIETALTKPAEPLQIAYPPDFEGQKSDEDATEFFVTTQPRPLTLDEIELVRERIKILPYDQSIVTGAVYIDEDDPLLDEEHDELDRIEADAKLQNTRNAPQGGERTVRERVLILREQGFTGNGKRALPQGDR